MIQAPTKGRVDYIHGKEDIRGIFQAHNAAGGDTIMEYCSQHTTLQEGGVGGDIDGLIVAKVKRCRQGTPQLYAACMRADTYTISKLRHGGYWFTGPPRNMSAISWNCRGMGNPRTVCTLKDLVSRYKPNFVFLMEVKVNREKVEPVKKQLKFEGLFYVEGVRKGRGVAFMWKGKQSVKLISFSENFIDMQIQTPHQPVWRLTGFYGFPERRRRRESWDLLRQLKDK